MTDNVGKMVNELINMNNCIEKLDDNISDLKKVS